METKPKTECACGCKKKFLQKTAWHRFFSAKCKHRYNRAMARKGRELDQNSQQVD